MKIYFFNTNSSKVEHGIDACYLSAYLLMADTAFFESYISFIMLVHKDIEILSYNKILILYKNYYGDDENILDDVEQAKKSLKEMNRFEKTKQHDKLTFEYIAKSKKILKLMRRIVEAEYQKLMIDYDLVELVPFHQNKILTLTFVTGNNDDSKERSHIKNIPRVFYDKEDTFSLTNHIENNFHFQTLTSHDSDDCAFIKIPLWKMPFIVQTPYEHLNYIREQLKPVLQPFKDKLKELKKEFFTMDFISENLPYFKQSISEKINPLILPVQQAIDESIYLSKIKNIFPENYGLTFCLGIASIETIINYYQQNQIIAPYEDTQMRERISRERNLKSTNIFTYFEVHNTVYNNFLKSKENF